MDRKKAADILIEAESPNCRYSAEEIVDAYNFAIAILKDEYRGRWIPYKVSFDGESLIKAEISDPNQTERFEIYDDLFLCSRCKKESFESEYCPHCGQRMEPVNYD